MKIRLYQVDAFTDTVFAGNPAAVCPLDSWPADTLLQQIAMENNLAETAFYVKKKEQFEIRWFTPAVEVELCGHATLAAAYALVHFEGYAEKVIRFYSPLSGSLPVRKEGKVFTLDFPTDQLEKISLTPELTQGFNYMPLEAWKGKTDYMLVFENEEQIRNLQPDLNLVGKLDARGVIVTARGRQHDFVSRMFAPQSGINEDPVTGSAHTTLTPFWSNVLGKETLHAAQLSARGGKLVCKYLGDRVEISGEGAAYMKGELLIG